MSGSPYASALGRFKALTPTFLPKELFANLVGANDVTEITKLLEPTSYGPELAVSAASYQGVTLLEIAVNRLFVRRNRLALDAAPFSGKPVLHAYLRRWDVQNIGLVLSAKANGRPVTETEAFLISSREIPAGLFAGAMTLDDFRILLEQPTLDAVASALVKFGYGATLLPLLDAYARTRDVFPLIQALERDYYARLLDSSRYFQGDEWVVRQFIQSEVDVRNVLLLLKGRDAELPVEEVASRFFDGGAFPRAQAQELYSARDVPELVHALEGRFPALPEGLPRYAENRSLVGFEVALNRARAVAELKRLRTYPLSLSVLFSFLLLSELERADLRRVVYGKVYGVANDVLTDSLIVPRL